MFKIIIWNWSPASNSKLSNACNFIQFLTVFSIWVFRHRICKIMMTLTNMLLKIKRKKNWMKMLLKKQRMRLWSWVSYACQWIKTIWFWPSVIGIFHQLFYICLKSQILWRRFFFCQNIKDHFGAQAKHWESKLRFFLISLTLLWFSQKNKPFELIF